MKKVCFDAFCNCSSLRECIVENNFCSLEQNLFKGCTSLTNVILPSINQFCFYEMGPDDCSILKKLPIKFLSSSEVTVNNELSSLCLSSSGFGIYPSSLSLQYITSIYVSSSLRSLDNIYGSYCSSLQELYIPKHSLSQSTELFGTYEKLKTILSEDTLIK